MARLLWSAALLTAALILAPLAGKANANIAPLTPSKYGSRHAEAVEFLKKSDYAKVVELEGKIIGSEPGDLTARFILAVAYVGLDNEKKALEQVEAAKKTDPQFAGDIYSAMGRFYMTKRRLHKALVCLQESLKIKEDPEVIKHVAAIYLGQGLLKNARDYFEKLPAQDPDNLNLSRIYLAEADFEKAVKYARQMLKADPKSSGAYLVLGTAYLMTGKLEEANDNFLVLKKSSPDFFLTSYFLGMIKLVRKDYDAAYSQFKALCTLTPKLREGYLNGAVALHKKGDLKKAEETARKAVEEDPLDSVSRLILGNIYLSMKDYARADAELKKASDIFPDMALSSFKSADRMMGAEGEAADISLAVLYNRAGLFKETLELTNQSAQISPYLKIARAKAFDKLGRAAEAEREYIEVLGGGGASSTALSGLGDLFEGKKEYGRSAVYYRQASDIAPALTKLSMKAAELYGKAGDDRMAIEEYRRVLAASAGTAPVYQKLSAIFLANGELHEALKYAKKGQAANPEDAELRDSLGWIYFQKGEYSKALDAYAVVVKNGSSDPVAWYHLGLVYQKLGKQGKAAEAFEKALNINDEFQHSIETKKIMKELSAIG